MFYVNRYLASTLVLIILFVKGYYTRMQFNLRDQLTKTILQAEDLRNSFVIYRF